MPPTPSEGVGNWERVGDGLVRLEGVGWGVPVVEGVGFVLGDSKGEVE